MTPTLGARWMVAIAKEASSVFSGCSEPGAYSETGQMEVPDNIHEVAWYQHGPAPGNQGSAVLAAHVDLAGEGPGVFFRLRDLRPGDRVWVYLQDGTKRVFVVQGRATYAKEELPLESIFAESGPAVLTLITCGGSFDSSRSRYESNDVVVYARPKGLTPRTRRRDRQGHALAS